MNDMNNILISLERSQNLIEEKQQFSKNQYDQITFYLGKIYENLSEKYDKQKFIRFARKHMTEDAFHELTRLLKEYHEVHEIEDGELIHSFVLNISPEFTIVVSMIHDNFDVFINDIKVVSDSFYLGTTEEIVENFNNYLLHFNLDDIIYLVTNL